MRCEQAFHPVLLFLSARFRQAHEGFLQCHCSRRVITRELHVLHSVEVALELLVAPIFHLDHLQSHAGALQRDIRHVRIDVADCGTHLCGDHADLHQRAAFLRFGAMPRGRVNDFVSEHRGEFGFVLQFGEQSAIDRDLPSGQCPGVGHRVVQHDKFIGQLAIRNCRELLADAVHVGSELWQHCEIATLALPGRREVLFADLQFLRFGYELDFLLSGDRVDAAGTECAHCDNCGSDERKPR